LGDLNKEKDLAMARLPRTFPRHACMLKSFYLEKDFAHLGNNLPIVAYFSDGKYNMAFNAVGSLSMAPVTVKGGVVDYVLARSLLVPLNTTKGDCGNLYAIKNRSTEGRKFCAMHVAGSPMFAHGSLLTQELLNSYLNVFGELGEFDIPDLPRTEPILAIPQFNYVGNITPAPSHSSRTTIKKSILYGKIEEVTMTNSLLKSYVNSEGVTVDPWHNALRKYCTPPPLIDEDKLTISVEDFRVFLKDNSLSRFNHRVLSIDEALFGIENESDFGPMKSNSSPGYPMNISASTNLKKQLFGNPIGSQERSIALTTIKKQVEEVLVELKRGNRVIQFCVDNLKDERRSFEKVREGKTRAFMGTPFIHCIIMRMYFGTYLLWVHKNKISNGCAIGVNPYSNDWDQLARGLSKHLIDREDEGVGAGDYSGFDASQNVFVMWRILDIINDEYNIPEDNKVRSILWENLTNSYHIVQGQVYSWDASLASGDLLTALVNCFTNQINFRYCWIDLGLDITLFKRNVFLNVMGDDNVFSVSHAYREIFNEMTIGKAMLKLGMNYTSETKTASVFPFRKISDVEYLKRRFIYDPATMCFIAPLRLEVVLDIPNWTRAGGLTRKITADNLSLAHQELSLHDTGVFDKYHKLFIELKEKYLDDMTFAHSIYHKQQYTRKILSNKEGFF
jgi:hypothetical protein